MKTSEFTIDIGTKIAAKTWHNPNGVPTLAMHGWLDNLATFDLLAPLLTDLEITAIDFPGHGLSQHKSHDHFFHVLEFAIDAIKVIESLDFGEFYILGHSLGAAIGTLMAGTLQERVKKLALIDGLGPMTTPGQDSPGQLRLFLSEAKRLQKRAKPPLYDSIDDMVNIRQKAGQINQASARILVERGARQVDGKWTWASDPRLVLPSALQMDEEQIFSFFREITAETILIRPTPGYPFNDAMMKKRTEHIPNLTIETVEGHHHVHLDDAPGVAAKLNPFF